MLDFRNYFLIPQSLELMCASLPVKSGVLKLTGRTHITSPPLLDAAIFAGAAEGVNLSTREAEFMLVRLLLSFEAANAFKEVVVVEDDG